MCICSNFSRRGLPRKFSLILTFFALLQFLWPRGCLEACFDAARLIRKIVCFAPSSHGREPELQQRMQMPFSQKARCFALTLLSPLRVWFAWHVQYFWRENWQRLVQILVAGAVFTACVTLNLQRRSRGETPKIGLKYGPTFKGQNQPPKMLS